MSGILQCSLLEVDQVSYTCTLGILAGDLHHLGIQIISLNIHDILHRHINCGFCIFSGLIPERRLNQIGPVFSSEVSSHTRRHIAGHHGSFDREGSGTTEGIQENSILVPGGQHNKSCSQGFRDGRLTRLQTIASLMQGVACRIDRYCNFIL